MRRSNPNLYPTSPSVMASLFASLGVHFSRLTIRTTTQKMNNAPEVDDAATKIKRPELPPELWALILEYIVEASYADYKYCNSHSFPIYQARHLWPNTVDDKEWATLLQDCSNVRLVSREWAAITRSFRTVTFKDQRREEMQGMKKLVIKYNERDLNTNITRGVTSSLRELILFRYRQDNLPTDHSGAVIDLLDNSHEFPNLRSLSIASSHVPPNFCTRLEQGFPLLVSLTLVHRVDQPVSLSLPRLEILDICWQMHINLALPSLKHCGFRRFRQMESIKPFLRSHGERLESLLISQPWSPFTIIPLRYKMDASVWTMCPNLKTLGWPLTYLVYLDPPPPDHPLCHLQFNVDHWKDGIEGKRDSTGKSVMNAINKFKVKCISTEFRSARNQDMVELMSFCDRNGVDFKWVPIRAVTLT